MWGLSLWLWKGFIMFIVSVSLRDRIDIYHCKVEKMAPDKRHQCLWFIQLSWNIGKDKVGFDLDFRGWSMNNINIVYGFVFILFLYRQLAEYEEIESWIISTWLEKV